MLPEFIQTFLPLYGEGDKRWAGFKLIAESLYALNRPVIIVETGSIRNPANFAGDGCATLLWNYIVRDTQGSTLTVDIDVTASQITQRLCAETDCMTADSITALRGHLPGPIDFLYLDSYDFQPGHEINSCMHQVGELGAIWERLPSGCLIASDDSHNAQQGKPVLTRQLLKCLGIEPILDSYVVIWRKS